MRSTHLDTKETILFGRASYYRRESNNKLVNCPEVDCSYKFAGGGMVSTVTDLIIFANAILYSFQSTSRDALLDQETAREFLAKQISVNSRVAAGLGWFLVCKKKVQSLKRRRSNDSYFYHTGAAVGASSVLLIKPGKDRSEIPSGLCVAILCNLQDVSVLKLAEEVGCLFYE
ncbi:unnamed protein product [Caenorhabditis sp. 36 PRJEB53466]|nr:unnamed protein product [Caenorhabditis sp. 36 PRJEB53466]